MLLPRRAIGLILLSLPVVYIVSCGDDENPVVSVPTEQATYHWWLESSYRILNYPQDFWGTSADNVYMAADDNLVQCRDGRWRVLFEYPDFGVTAYQGFKAIWGYAADSFVTVGYRGVIMSYRAGELDTVALETDATLYGVWGSSENNIYAIGAGSAGSCVYHYDGSGWADVTFDRDLYTSGVWVSATGIPYLISGSGIWTLSDTGWCQFEEIPGLYYSQAGITGKNQQELFVDGYGDTVWWFNGSEWTAENVMDHVYGLKCSNDTAVLAYTEDKRILVRIGEQWNQVPSEAIYTSYWGMTCGWASSLDNIWISRQPANLFRYDGSSWTCGWGDAITSSSLHSVLAVDASDVFIGTGEGSVIRNTDRQWSEHYLGTADSILALWGPDKNHVYAASSGGAIYRFDGVAWSIAYALQGATFSDVFGTKSGDVFGLGYSPQEQRALIVKWDGVQWVRILDTLALRPTCMCESGDNLYVFTEDGYFARAGEQWQYYDEAPVVRDACEMGGQLWCVGDASVFSFDGTTWTEQYTYEDSAKGPNGIWIESSQSLLVAGGDPRLIRYSDGNWSTVANVNLSVLTAIDGTSASDIWAVGREGIILHYGL